MSKELHNVLRKKYMLGKYCPYQLACKWEIILLLLRKLAVVKLNFGQNLMQ